MGAGLGSGRPLPLNSKRVLLKWLARGLNIPVTSGETVGEGGTENDAEGIDELKAALREAQEQQAAKDVEIARLQEQLEKEKKRGTGSCGA